MITISHTFDIALLNASIVSALSVTHLCTSGPNNSEPLPHFPSLATSRKNLANFGHWLLMLSMNRDLLV